LLFGLPRSTIQQVFKALLLAFGAREGQADRTQGESLRLAQVLWQTIKSRSQRRLKEICSLDLDFDESYRQASQSLRRAGLYVSGDLKIALLELAREFGIENADDKENAARMLVERVIETPDGLDLVRFATSAEYADVRWQSSRMNQPMGGGRPW
jgi:hypothetical protein